MSEPMSDARLTEIEAAIMRVPRGPYVDGTQQYPLMAAELLLEVHQLRRLYRELNRADLPHGALCE